MRRGQAFVGCSGWSYRHWRGGFYPQELPPRRWLEAYAKRFPTVEVNTSFYRIPKAGVVAGWSGRTPPGFRFAFKLWRGFTHYARLIGKRDVLASYLDVVDAVPPGRRGPLLIHLHPQMRADSVRIARLDAFLADLADSAWQVAVEFRNPEWIRPDVFRLLESRGAGVCVHDMPEGRTLEPNDVPFVYVRRHGPLKYSAPYTDRQLRHDARQVDGWLDEGRDVYAYFNNDVGGFAPRDAMRLQALLDGEPVRRGHWLRQVGHGLRAAARPAR